MKFTSIIFLIIFLILPSPIFRAFLPLTETNYTILFTIILLIILSNKTYITELKFDVKFFGFLLIGSIASNISNSYSQLNILIFFTLSIFISANLLKLIDHENLANTSQKICFLMIFFAWLGFFLTLYNPEPIGCIVNPDGRLNCLYFSTFSNTDNVEFWRMIRPSAIFDEPGAFSFFIVLVVIMNLLIHHRNSKQNKINILLFSTGIITFSLTHFILFLTYLLIANAISFKRIVTILSLALSVILLGILYFDSDSIIYQNFLSRFTFTDDGNLSGDNRSSQIKNFFELLDYDISTLGANEKYKNFPYLITEIDQSSNPFSIWFNYGLVAWIPYLLILSFLGLKIFNSNTSKNTRISSILLMLLLLQRPYIFSPMWGMSIAFILTMIYKYSKYQTNQMACFHYK